MSNANTDTDTDTNTNTCAFKNCQNMTSGKYCDTHTCWKCYQVVAMEEDCISCIDHKCKVIDCSRIAFSVDGEGDCFKCMLDRGDSHAREIYNSRFGSPWDRFVFFWLTLCRSKCVFAKGVMGGNVDLRSMLLRGASNAVDEVNNVTSPFFAYTFF